jgi:hypothetical protein
MKLSILIPTLESRREKFRELTNGIEKQLGTVNLVYSGDLEPPWCHFQKLIFDDSEFPLAQSVKSSWNVPKAITSASLTMTTWFLMTMLRRY